MLQTFTLSYPDSKSYGPKIYVIFTNFSKHFDSDEDLNSKYFEYDSDHENQNESDVDFDEVDNLGTQGRLENSAKKLMSTRTVALVKPT